MREILFRGKRKDNWEWVQGDLIQLHDERKFVVDNKFGACIDDKGNFINTESPFVCEVIPETIGQYTGLTDKNGKKIFEGDIVKIHYDSDIWGNNREVVFEEGQWFFKDNAKTQKSYIGAWGNSVVEVIGNIHDNPELLGGEQNAR